MHSKPLSALAEIERRIAAAAAARSLATGMPAEVALLAVSKLKPADAVRALAADGQRAFGENYVQEGVRKITELADHALAWHLIGPLQSNKCREAAVYFDRVSSVDRAKLIEPLARHRPAHLAPLDVLVQVDVEGEASKSGVAPDAAEALCAAVASQPRLALRGLMAIPAPHQDPALRRAAFRRMKALFDAIAPNHPRFDVLSMGMSDDFELAIAEGATEVRVGTALFGHRPAKSATPPTATEETHQ